MEHLKTKFDEFVADSDNHRLFEQEALVLGATETIASLMESKNVNKASLARMLGTTKSHVTELFSGIAI